MTTSVAFLFILIGGVVGCASGPRLSFAVEERLLRETTLDDLPEDGGGVAEARDNVVRVFQSGGGTCSGALVGPRHVLTAAHCVVDSDRARREMSIDPAVPGVMRVELGGDYLPWGRVGVVGVKVCDEYLGDLEHDVAVLVLGKPVPSIVRPRPIVYDAETTGAYYELSGFGTSAKARTMPGTAWPIYSTQRNVRSGPAFPLAVPNVVLTAAGSVPGDSGGPIVDTRTGAIVSLVSRGLDPAKAKQAKALLGDIPLTAGPNLALCRASIEAGLAWREPRHRANRVDRAD